MKIIKDLINAYAHYVGLPIMLINLEGEVEYRKDPFRMDDGFLASQSYTLLDMKNIAFNISAPTVITITDYHFKEAYCMVTPVLQINQSPKLILAGPFLFYSMDSKAERDLLLINEKELIVYKDKIINLYLIITNYLRLDENTSSSFSLELMNRMIDKLTDSTNDSMHELEEFFLEFVNIGMFDFVGRAVKGLGDKFVIENVVGLEKSKLVGNSFYLGEGLLGRVALFEKEEFFNRQSLTGMYDYMHKLDVNPSFLFGFPIKNNNQVEEVIFCGFFQQEIVNELSLLFFKSTIQFLIKKNYRISFQTQQHLKNLFVSWVDLIHLIDTTKDESQIPILILNFCHVLNSHKFCCYSNYEGDNFIRGESEAGIVMHQKVIEYSQILMMDQLIIEDQYVHFFLGNHGERKGIFTLEFSEGVDLAQLSFIFNILDKYQNKRNLNKNVLALQLEIFDTLMASVKELNEYKFNQCTIALQFIEKLMDFFELEDSTKEVIINVCKVGMYSVGFLEERIEGTREWDIIKEVDRIRRSKKIRDDYSLNIKILLYVYSIIYQEEKYPKLEFLSSEERAVFNKTYRTVLEAMPSNSLFIEKEISHIDEIIDIKEIISTMSLTSREKEVLYLIIEGLNNLEVANYLNISIHTVKNHVTNIFKKLNVSDRVQAMAMIYRIKYNDF